MNFTGLITRNRKIIQFIPPLIFEGAFGTEYHIVFREIGQVCILAIFGVAINTVLTACAAILIFPDDYEWDWSVALLYGATVSDLYFFIYFFLIMSIFFSVPQIAQKFG